MSKGEVKYFNENRGWGIISNCDTEEDVYVHYTALRMDGYKTLKQGQQVLYELSQSDCGPSALNVTVAQ